MKKRIISALILILITTPFIIIGKLPFTIFVVLVSQLTLYELLQFRKKIPLYIKIISHIIVGIICIYDLLKIPLDIVISIDSIIFLILLLFTNKNKYHYKDAFFLIGITLFIGLIFNNFIIVRNTSLLIFIYLLLIAFLTDTFAFFIGKKFGKHKLAPRISPNKTIEGLIGGVGIGSIISIIYYIFMIDKSMSIFIIIIISIFLSIMGQIGDLVKSQIKRYENVKDFSTLIPGHGGIIDRLDSLIFVSIVYMIIYRFI